MRIDTPLTDFILPIPRRSRISSQSDFIHIRWIYSVTEGHFARIDTPLTDFILPITRRSRISSRSDFIHIRWIYSAYGGFHCKFRPRNLLQCCFHVRLEDERVVEIKVARVDIIKESEVERHGTSCTDLAGKVCRIASVHIVTNAVDGKEGVIHTVLAKLDNVVYYLVVIEGVSADVEGLSSVVKNVSRSSSVAMLSLDCITSTSAKSSMARPQTSNSSPVTTGICAV